MSIGRSRQGLGSRARWRAAGKRSLCRFRWTVTPEHAERTEHLGTWKVGLGGDAQGVHLQPARGPPDRQLEFVDAV